MLSSDLYSWNTEMRSHQGLLRQSFVVLSEAAEVLGGCLVCVGCSAARTGVEGLLLSAILTT